MKVIRIIRSLGIVSLVFIVSGCSDAKMPEVNNINCQHENILKIEDKAMQQDFASKCLRRGGFKPSPPKSW